MAGKKIKGITIEIGGETKPLEKALGDVNKKTRDLQSELKSVERLLKLDPKNTELLAQKQKLLAEAADNSREKLDRLKRAQEQVNQAFQRGDLGEEQYRHFSRQVINAEQDLKKLESQLKDTGTAADGLGDKMKSAGGKLKGIGQGMSIGVTAPIVGGMVAVTESTEELRGDLARLETNAKQAGQSMGVLDDAMAKMYGVTGEIDSNVEGLSNILATGFKDEKLSELVDAMAGASIKFSDTLKFEGIADGLQETLATGKSIGMFDELLSRSGVNLDQWNAGLTEAIANGTQQEYVLETLAKTGLAETYKEYKKNNEAMVENKEAQYELQQAMADMATALLPIMTSVTNAIKSVVEWFNGLSPVGKKLTLIIAGIVAAIGPLLGVISVIMMAAPAITAAIGAISLPVLGVVAAIAAVIAIAVLLIKNWDKIKAKGSELLASISATFESIKASISEKIEAVKNTVKNTIEAIKGFFTNLSLPEIKIPKIKLPHFNITGGFSISPPKVPSFGVKWYDTGGIFSSPNIIGVGEKRTEVVAPLAELKGMLADTIKEVNGGGKGPEYNIKIYNPKPEPASNVRRTLMQCSFGLS